MQNGLPRPGNAPQAVEATNEETPVLQGFADVCDSVRIAGMDDIGPELLRDAKAETAFSVCSAAPALQNGLFDSGLERLIELWPMLVLDDRAILLAKAKHFVAQQKLGSVAGR